MVRPLFVDSVVADSSTPHGVLKMAAKRYTSTGTADGGDGSTLLLAHASGTHKEHWEPTIERLFELATESSGLFNIREVWAVDWPTHGDSAALNAGFLRDSSVGTSISDWAEAIAAFVKTNLASHRIVTIGHSAGCSAMMYSTRCFTTVPYESIILVEPPLIDRQVFQDNIQDRTRQTGVLTKAIAAQRSQWASRADAYGWFASRFPWKGWDDRVLRVHVNQGLRLVDENDVRGPVTSKCDKRHEAASYTDFEPTFQAVEQIEKVCREIPIHVIFGAVNDLVPRYSQDCIDPAKGRHVASVTRVPGAGHMIVQQKPNELAEILFSKFTFKQTPDARL